MSTKKFDVVMLDSAESNMESIWDYHAAVAGVSVADTILSTIYDQLASLRAFPERTRPGRVTGTRELVMSGIPYIAIVEICENSVFVANVLHTSRRYPPNRSD
jgi:toxin ParE1/3/4